MLGGFNLFVIFKISAREKKKNFLQSYLIMFSPNFFLEFSVLLD